MKGAYFIMNYKKIVAVLAAIAIIGSSTYAVSDKLLFDNVLTVSAAATLRRNSTGSAVKSLQNNLIAMKYLKSGSATGKYDAATESAVKQFQTDYNLTADGVAGSKTLSLIEGLVNGTAKVFEVKSTLLNVRKTPSTNGQIIATVKKGQHFQVEEETADSDGTKWYRITTRSGAGYICSDYVVLNDSSSQRIEHIDESAKKGILKVTGSVLNVRKSASTSAKKLYTIKLGQTYYFTNMKTVNGDKWYYIKVNGKISGWVLGKWAVPIQTESEIKGVAKSGRLKVVVNILQVRASASTSAKRLYTTKLDEEYNYSNVKRINNIDWYYIKVNSKISGWVLGTMVSATPKGSESTTASTKATTTLPSSSDPNGGTLKVTVDQLNVRESTSTSSKKLFVAKRDQVYAYSKTKTAENTEWYYIKVNNSISGWVMGQYIKATPNPTVTQKTESTKATQTTKAAGASTVTVNVDALTVRENASTDSKKLFVAKRDQVYTYSKTKKVGSDTWYYIKVNNSISGWVIGKYVKATPAETASTAESTKATQTAKAAGSTVTVNVDALNVRESASTDSKKLFVAKRDQVYTYSKTKKVGSDTWYYIKVNNSISGWVIGKYVKVTPAETETTKAAESSTGTLTVTTDALNVRQSASTSSKKVSLVKKGQKYTYTKTQKVAGDTWYYIKVSSSVSGWINGKYVSTGTQTTAATKPTASEDDKSSDDSDSKGRLTVTAELLNVRSDADSNAKVVTTVKKDNTYSYTAVKTVKDVTWYYITVSDSVKGWINGSFTNLAAAPTQKPTTTTATKKTTTTTATTTKKTTTTTAKKTTTTTTATTKKPTTTTTKKTTPTVKAGEGKHVVIEANLLNVRIEPSATATVIGTVRKDKIYEYSKTKSAEGITWYYIKVSDVRWGWVMGTFVSEVEEKSVPQEESKTGTLTVTASVVNVRMGAGTNYEKVATVREGEKYPYVDVKDGWYRIKVASDKLGWIHGSFVKTDSSQKTTSSPASQGTTSAAGNTTSATEKTTTTTEKTTATTATTSASAEVTTTTAETTTTTSAPGDAVAAGSRTVLVGTVSVSGSLNIRKGAGTNYAIIGSVKNGAKLVIAEKGSKWHKVEYGSGYGYVLASYLKNVQSVTQDVPLSYASSYCYVDPGKSVNLARSVKSAVTYTSSDPENCPVDANGVATGKKAGLYTVTAKSGSAKASVCVVVLDAPNKNVPTFRISEAGAKFIAEWEGGGTVLPTGETVYYPYKDVSGFWTVGYGHAKTTAASKSWSESKAIAEFNADIEALIGKEYILTSEKPYLSEETAKMLLNADLNKGDYVKSINNWATRNGVVLNQNQFDALVSFCYNIGSSLWDSDSSKFYLKSAIIARRSGSAAVPDQIIEGFCRYHKSGGKAYKGLWYRRRNEAELFLTGDYAIDRENKFTLPTGVSWS